MSEIVIREANRDDCHGISAMVQQANFTGMSGGPEIGPEALQRDGFDAEHPFFKCFVAEIKNMTPCPAGENNSDTKGLVGYALYCNTYSTWMGPSLYLEDLYCIPEVRSKGVGSALFDRVVKEAYDIGCCRLDLTVLNWNPATEFYKQKGAIDVTIAKKWHHYTLDKEAIEALCTKKQKS